MLSAVGPAAIEMGLVKAKADETIIKIRAVNTGGRFVSKVKTPHGKLIYEGETSIDGVPGTAAPVELKLWMLLAPKQVSFFQQEILGTL